MESNLYRVATEYTSMAIISFPIFFLVCTIISCIWFSVAFNKKIITFNSSIVWLSINILFLLISIYLLVIGLIETFNPSFDYDSYNFFIWISEKIFGASKESWVVLIVLLISLIIGIISINVAVRFDKQNKKINELNRNLAILKGKIAIEMNEMHFDTTELSKDELKFLLEEQLAKEKLKLKFKNKLEKLSEKSDDVHTDIDTKTLLSIKKEKSENENINENN